MASGVRSLRRAVLLIGALAVAVTVTGATAQAATSCKEKRFISVILDDSGSMRSSDRNALRADAALLLIENHRMARNAVQVIEFGSSASEVVPWQFIPATSAGRGALIKAVLDATKADNQDTNYNAAFSLANVTRSQRTIDSNFVDRSNLDARIFLTDGRPTAKFGPLDGGHRVGIPTYPIGFGDANRRVLDQIARDTGVNNGRAFTARSPGQLLDVMNRIVARLACDRLTRRSATVKPGRTRTARSPSLSTKDTGMLIDFILGEACDAADVACLEGHRLEQKRRATASDRRRLRRNITAAERRRLDRDDLVLDAISIGFAMAGVLPPVTKSQNATATPRCRLTRTLHLKRRKNRARSSVAHRPVAIGSASGFTTHPNKALPPKLTATCRAGQGYLLVDLKRKGRGSVRGVLGKRPRFTIRRAKKSGRVRGATRVGFTPHR